MSDQSAIVRLTLHTFHMRLRWRKRMGRERLMDRAYKRSYDRTPATDEEREFGTACLALFAPSWTTEVPWNEEPDSR